MKNFTTFLSATIFLFAVIHSPTFGQDNIPTTYSESNKDRHSPTFQHLTLVVSDFDVSRKFYIDLLGLEPVDADWLSDKQMFISLGHGLELHMGEVPGVEIKPSSFNHFAMSVPDFEGFLRHLKENDVIYMQLGGGEPYKYITRPDGVRQTFFQDPDGYWLEVNDFKFPAK